MRILGRIKKEIGLPILTDIHYPAHAAPAAEMCDILQIPAYLCMQTELVTAVAKTGAVVNLKHGQFIAPDNMIKPVQKIQAVGGDKIILTERGHRPQQHAVQHVASGVGRHVRSRERLGASFAPVRLIRFHHLT